MMPASEQTTVNTAATTHTARNDFATRIAAIAGTTSSDETSSVPTRRMEMTITTATTTAASVLNSIVFAPDARA